MWLAQNVIAGWIKPNASPCLGLLACPHESSMTEAICKQKTLQTYATPRCTHRKQLRQRRRVDARKPLDAEVTLWATCWHLSWQTHQSSMCCANSLHATCANVMFHETKMRQSGDQILAASDTSRYHSCWHRVCSRLSNDTCVMCWCAKPWIPAKCVVLRKIMPISLESELR